MTLEPADAVVGSIYVDFEAWFWCAALNIDTEQ